MSPAQASLAGAPSWHGRKKNRRVAPLILGLHLLHQGTPLPQNMMKESLRCLLPIKHPSPKGVVQVRPTRPPPCADSARPWAVGCSQVVTSFTLGNALGLAICSRLGDKLGRRFLARLGLVNAVCAAGMILTAVRRAGRLRSGKSWGSDFANGMA